MARSLRPSTESMLTPPIATVWTVGHSTRSWEAFLALLREPEIDLLVDVRHYPSSARAPWANQAGLVSNLQEAGLSYEHLVDLGGYRKPRPDSRNTGWRNAGFRGYADYMETDPFRTALDRLIALAKERRTAIMCAEAVPWRCHRGVLSDALLVRGVRVIHILPPRTTQEHALAPFAMVRGGRVTYPAARGKT
jgi:uncharacterized protein (DUF488 family)